jgi:hypothetical protein
VTVVVLGIVLVRNEDVFLEQAIRNVAAFCDRIVAYDHMSTDRTADVLARLARDLDHLTVTRTRDASESHRAVEPYVGSDAWAFGVDGDELYDPAGLGRLRPLLEEGAYASAFHLKAHVLNCTGLDRSHTTATGHMAPPSRPVTKLFNLNAVEAWPGSPERLHAGAPVFREGFGWSSLRYVSDETEWSTDPLRMLHVCFLRRSSRDDAAGAATRRNLSESGLFHRGPRGALQRLRHRRSMDPRIKEYRSRGTTWKQEWYARGPAVSVDARPFFGPRPAGVA